MRSDGKIDVVQIFDEVTIAASGSSTTIPIDMNAYRPIGNMSLQIEITGDGTAKGEYLGSNNGTDYVVPADVSDIFTNVTKTPGKAIYKIVAPQVEKAKIKITETGGANSITVSGWLAIQ